MTFTAIARDPQSGQLGIAIATYSLAVGASCPYITPGVGAVSTQAATFPAHGPRLLELVQNGVPVDEAFDKLHESDQHFEYRQIGLITTAGETSAHTGTMTRDWAGSLSGDGWLVIGNVLAGKHVVAAMAEALQQGEKLLADRLTTALEAGRDSGGQIGLEEKYLPERSAVLTVYGSERFPQIDLRVDDHPDAVTELRRIFDRFSKASSYYQSRAGDPASAGPQDVWMAEHGLE